MLIKDLEVRAKTHGPELTQKLSVAKDVNEMTLKFCKKSMHKTQTCGNVESFSALVYLD